MLAGQRAPGEFFFQSGGRLLSFKFPSVKVGVEKLLHTHTHNTVETEAAGTV